MWRHMRRNQISSFARNGPVHLNRPVVGFSSVDCWQPRCAPSAVVMMDTACSEVVWRVLATHFIQQFPPSLPLPWATVCHHISTGLYTKSSFKYALDCSACGPSSANLARDIWVGHSPLGLTFEALNESVTKYLNLKWIHEWNFK